MGDHGGVADFRKLRVYQTRGEPYKRRLLRSARDGLEVKAFAPVKGLHAFFSARCPLKGTRLCRATSCHTLCAWSANKAAFTGWQISKVSVAIPPNVLKRSPTL